MSRTLEQWIALYNKKVAEKFERDKRFALLYSPEKGFCEIGDTGKMVIVNQMCGDFLFWRDAAESYAKKNGYKHVGTLVVRPILPYLRLGRCNITSVEETNIGDRYFGVDRKTGQKIEASPIREGVYCVIVEVI